MLDQRQPLKTSRAAASSMVMLLMLLPVQSTKEIQPGLYNRAGCWDSSQQIKRQLHEEWFTPDCKRNCSCQLGSLAHGMSLTKCSPIRCRLDWPHLCPNGQKPRRHNCCNECPVMDRAPRIATRRQFRNKLYPPLQKVCPPAKYCKNHSGGDSGSHRCVNPVRLSQALCPRCPVLCAGSKACQVPLQLAEEKTFKRKSWLMPGELRNMSSCGTCLCVNGNLRCHKRSCNTELRHLKDSCLPYRTHGKQLSSAGTIKAKQWSTILSKANSTASCTLCACIRKLWECQQFPGGATATACRTHRRLSATKSYDKSDQDVVTNSYSSNMLMVLLLLTILVLCLAAISGMLLVHITRVRREHLHDTKKKGGSPADSLMATNVQLLPKNCDSVTSVASNCFNNNSDTDNHNEAGTAITDKSDFLAQLRQEI